MPQRKIHNRKEILNDIIKLLYTNLKSTFNVVKHIQNKYDICQATAYNYVKDAKEEVGRYYKEANVNVLENAISKLESLQDNALEENDNKLYLEIQKEINKVLQLHIQKIEHDIKTEQPLFGKNEDDI